MPTIDISMIARLDELGVPHAPDSPIFRTSGHASAPAEATAAPMPRGPSPAAFRPPAELTDAPLGVERSTRAIRIENQWQRELTGPSPAFAGSAQAVTAARRSGAGLLIAVVLIAAAAIAVVMLVVR
jgi:hypothetical protein